MGVKDPLIRQACVRCGTCCQKGGPALHLQDRSLYLDGHLAKGDLLTLRKGERVYDNVREKVIELGEEVVRLRACAGSTACLFFDDASNRCSIYDYRPIECRVLKCWDPTGLTAMYHTDRIGRLGLISQESALGILIEEHERRCGYAQIKPLAEAVHRKSNKALQEIAARIEYDHGIRESLKQKAGAGESELEFLFGRPFQETLPTFGLNVQVQQGTVRVTPVVKE